MTRSNIVGKHSNLRRFARTLANERFSQGGTRIHLFLHQTIQRKSEISTALKEISHKKV
jgi:hypothetical protein